VLILGVDGGGSKTAVRVAKVDASGEIHELGSGFAGPSNVRAVGLEVALENLDNAVGDALRAVGSKNAEVGVAVLALAGSSLPVVQSQVTAWAENRDLASLVEVVHDAEPVLAVGVGDRAGIALIVGTGSVATGINEQGERLVSGGWGHWFGDLGSGFDLGRSSLAAVAKAVDGIGVQTALVGRVLAALNISDAREIVKTLQHATDIRREIAALAPVLLRCAEEQDDVAVEIVARGASETATLVTATATKLKIGTRFPLALAGGIACSSEYYRDRLMQQILRAGLHPDPLVVVDEPVVGSLMLARDRLMSRGQNL
jgi:N-acetylglucosamine kinase-like BadF-type ATPase